MENLQEIYRKYQHPAGYDRVGGDKGTNHSYIEVYQDLFKDIQDKTSNLLEIGVQNGYSVNMWKDYFPKATIHGIDIDSQCKKHQKERIKIYIMNATDSVAIQQNLAMQTFDIIIDDGSHHIADQKNTFTLLFPKLNPGGLYIIEDILTIDQHRHILEGLHPKTIIMDRRIVKGRSDDVLVVIKKE